MGSNPLRKNVSRTFIREKCPFDSLVFCCAVIILVDLLLIELKTVEFFCALGQKAFSSFVYTGLIDKFLGVQHNLTCPDGGYFDNTDIYFLGLRLIRWNSLWFCLLCVHQRVVSNYRQQQQQRYSYLLPIDCFFHLSLSLPLSLSLSPLSSACP